jgi:hypothetical protein
LELYSGVSSKCYFGIFLPLLAVLVVLTSLYKVVYFASLF